MKLADRQLIAATSPPIHIGKRPYVDKRTGRRRMGKPYWAEYFRDGRQHQVSLTTSSKAQALRAAYELAEQLERGEGRPRDSHTLIQDLAEQYMTECRGRGRAPKTVVKYQGQLNRFTAWCQSQGVRKAKMFSPDDLFAYRTYLSEACRLSDKSIYGETVLLKQLFKWAEKTGRLSRNALALLRFDKVKSRLQPCYTIEQVELLLANAEPWAVPMFATLAYTGIRIGELQQLQWEDVDFEGNVLHIRRGGSSGRTKNRQDRLIPIHGSKLKPLLQTLPRSSQLVFLMPNGSKVNPKSLLRYLKRLCGDCGFKNPQQYKVHTFRHFFASYCAQQNRSYKYVLAWMGHSSSDILDLYFKINDREAQRAMNDLSFCAENAESRTTVGQSGGGADQTRLQVVPS